jgi:D-aminopeptidase
MQVGRVYDAACRLLMAEQPAIGVDDVVIPVVGECDDSWLSDPRAGRIRTHHVAAAWSAARASAGSQARPVEGAVGAGTGMTCLGWKGGIGTSSRVLPDGHAVGVLLLCNFGQWDRLTVDGVAVGRALGRPAHVEPPPAGSCLGVVVTDAPLDAVACERLARRVGLGLARAGSTAHHSSGELFLALATGLRAERGSAPAASPLQGRALDPYFEAVVDAAEESVIGCLLSAQDTDGRSGRSVAALPVDRVREILSAHGRGQPGG